MKGAISVLVLILLARVLVQLSDDPGTGGWWPVYRHDLIKHTITILVAAGCGLLAAYLARKWPPLFERHLVPLAIAVLCCLMVLAQYQGGFNWPFSRWFRWGSLSVQPSEPLRLVTAVGLTLAIGEFKNFVGLATGRTWLIWAGLFLLLVEGDLSTLLLLALSVCGALHFLGRNKAALAVSMVSLVVIAGLVVLHSNTLTHRLPLLGGGYVGRTQLDIAMDSIGTAPVFGSAGGSQPTRIPVGTSDFFLAMAISTYGRFFGAVLFMACLAIPLLVSKWYLRVERRTHYRVLCACWASFCLAETLLHAFVNVGLFPVMGVNLPFAGPGGTSIVVYLGTMVFLIVTAVGKTRTDGVSPSVDPIAPFKVPLVSAVKVMSIVVLLRLLVI